MSTIVPVSYVTSWEKLIAQPDIEELIVECSTDAWLRTEKDIKDIFNEKNTIHMFTQGLDKDYFVHVHMVMMRLGM